MNIGSGVCMKYVVFRFHKWTYCTSQQSEWVVAAAVSVYAHDVGCTQNQTTFSPIWVQK